MNELRTMHLFAGIGGGLLADLILGHRPIVAVEWDPYACQVLRERAAEGWFPELHVWEGDVRLFDPSEYAGKVDCIHAGFPCQPFSNAGTRNGSTDVRGDLFAEVLRCVEAIKPKYIFLENVSALLTSKSPVCVCGWPYRRGGVFEDSQAGKEINFDLYPGYSNCNVEQGQVDSESIGGRVRRENIRHENEIREMVGSMDVAYQWGRGDAVSCKNLSIPDVEEAASGFIDGTSYAEEFHAYAEERNKSMDDSSERIGGSNEGEDAHPEQEGCRCPGCGGWMVHGSRFIRYFDAILWSLSSHGYDCRWLCLRASDVGAPHHRDRWWLLADSKRNEQSREKPCVMKVGRVGRCVEPLAWDRNWKDSLRCLRRMDVRTPHQVDRTDGIRNAQVPLQAATAWRLLGGE